MKVAARNSRDDVELHHRHNVQDGAIYALHAEQESEEAEDPNPDLLSCGLIEQAKQNVGY